MRNWLFHPLLFYPLVAILAAVVIFVSIRPQSWPRQPAPVAGEIQRGILVLQREAFNSPDKSPEQNLTIARDLWGHAQTMHIAVLPGMPPPTPAETGVRILLTEQSAAVLGDGPVTVDVSYRPQPVNTAKALAVSLQGIGPADWVTQPIQPQAGLLRFQLPPGLSPNAIGLRVISDETDQSYGLEIVRIAAYPTSAAPAAAPAPAPPAAQPAPQTSQPAPSN